MAQPVKITVPLESGTTVSGLIETPVEPIAAFVFAHGAGAGMEHSFMSEVAERLANRGIATLRYQFPYMESGSKRPDRPPVAHAAVRAAVKAAGEAFPGLPIFAGGRSFGGRMTSQAQAGEPLAGVRGLIFLGFPLHETDKPSTERAEHLECVAIPMLFLQGTRDKLAEIERVRSVVGNLAKFAQLVEIDEADHSFHVLKRSGRTDEEALSDLIEGLVSYVLGVLRER